MPPTPVSFASVPDPTEDFTEDEEAFSGPQSLQDPGYAPRTWGQFLSPPCYPPVHKVPRKVRSRISALDSHL
eukprot:10132025-Prorocentrum_lima.AAC.1